MGMQQLPVRVVVVGPSSAVGCRFPTGALSARWLGDPGPTERRLRGQSLTSGAATPVGKPVRIAARAVGLFGLRITLQRFRRLNEFPYSSCSCRLAAGSPVWGFLILPPLAN